MSEMLIPIGGAGGKNRGDFVVFEDKTKIRKIQGGNIVGTLLPGVYKAKKDNKIKFPELDDEFELSGFGDGINTTVIFQKDYIRELAMQAFGISSVTNFSSAPRGHKQTLLTWTKPTSGAMWSGVRIITWPKSQTAPPGPYDINGKWYYDTADSSVLTPVMQNIPYFAKIISYVTVSDGRWYQDFSQAPTIQFTPVASSGSQSFSAGSGVWTVPSNVYKLRYILVGQGGFGGTVAGIGVGGGGGGGYFRTGYMDVTPGQQIPWLIPGIRCKSAGYGGRITLPGSFQWKNWDADVVVKFGSVTAPPGKEGGHQDYDYYPGKNRYFEYIPKGGDGGSGGASGGQYVNYSQGGVNGGNGPGQWPGIGQGSSTTGFNGVLYSTGGASVYYGKSVDMGEFGTDGLGNGGGGGKGMSKSRRYYEADGGKGGDGCIYVAWGTLMNDGTT